jgi:hypothetical protein
MVVLTWLAVLALQEPEPAPDAAQALFNEGVGKLRQSQKEGDKEAARKLAEEALVPLRKVVAEHRKSKLYGASHFNLGVAFADFLDKPEEAVREFEALIASDVDDKDATGELMSPFRNYRYRSWMMISACREKLKKPGPALDAAFRMPAAYVSHCGTCVAGMQKEFRRRVAELCKDFATAEEVDAALALHKGAEAFLLALGKELAAQGKTEKARAALTLLAEGFPQGEPAREAKKALEGLK